MTLLLPPYLLVHATSLPMPMVMAPPTAARILVMVVLLFLHVFIEVAFHREVDPSLP
jgi:hypothetical protein